jgi:hypothetical protein
MVHPGHCCRQYLLICKLLKVKHLASFIVYCHFHKKEIQSKFVLVVRTSNVHVKYIHFFYSYIKWLCPCCVQFMSLASFPTWVQKRIFELDMYKRVPMCEMCLMQGHCSKMVTMLYRGRCMEGLFCKGMDFGRYIHLYSHLCANLKITHFVWWSTTHPGRHHIDKQAQSW